MAISYTTQATIVEDRVWRRRVRQAVTKAAIDILGETTSGNAAIDDKRWRLATRVMQSDGAAFSSFEAASLANIGAGVSTANAEDEITDGDLDTAVASIWNDVAGVLSTD